MNRLRQADHLECESCAHLATHDGRPALTRRPPCAATPAKPSSPDQLGTVGLVGQLNGYPPCRRWRRCFVYGPAMDSTIITG